MVTTTLAVQKTAAMAHMDEKNRKRLSIYAVDVHPQRLLVATGGQDCHVRLWDMQSFSMVAKLHAHNGSVLSVRFHPTDPHFLASSSDGDNVVIVWHHSDTWRVMATLGGSHAHQSDVVDLAWSPDGTFLASCGLDGRILIWAAHDRSFALVKTLTAHADFVKGIAFDPTGQFLASQSDDHSLIVWATFDWSPAKRITRGFEKSFGQGFFKRLSWAPDGGWLCAVQANDESGHVSTAMVIGREKWREDVCLVGHRMVSECSAYNPQMFLSTTTTSTTSTTSTDTNQEPFSVCALGAQDGSISIWFSNKPRAPIVIANVFSSSVLDLRWSPDGQLLVACSIDGTVALIRIGEFEPGQPYRLTKGQWKLDAHGYGAAGVDTVFGRTVGRQVVEERMERYGYQRSMTLAEKRKREEIPEYVEFSRMAESHAAVQASTHPLPALPTTADLMTRRIQPTTHSSGAMAAAGTTDAMGFPSMSVLSTQANTSTNATLTQQRVTTTKDGKRRVQPVMLSSPSQPSQQQAVPVFGAGSGGPLFQTATSMNAAASASASNPSNVPASTTVLQPAKVIEKPVVSDLPIDLPVPPYRLKLIKEFPMGAGKMSLCAEQNVHKGVTRVKFESTAGGRLGVCWVDYVSSPVLDLTTSTLLSTASNPHHLHQGIILASLSDGSLITWTLYGRRKFPPLQLDSPVSQSHCAVDFFGVVTKRGAVWVWHFGAGSGKVVLKGVSVAPVLTRVLGEVEKYRKRQKESAAATASSTAVNGSAAMNGHVHHMAVEDGDGDVLEMRKMVSFNLDPVTGLPTIAVDNYSVYTFDLQMGVWIRVQSHAELDRLSDRYALTTTPATRSRSTTMNAGEEAEYVGDERVLVDPATQWRAFLKDATSGKYLPGDVRLRASLASLENAIYLAMLNYQNTPADMTGSNESNGGCAAGGGLLKEKQAEVVRDVLREYVMQLADAGEVAVSRTQQLLDDILPGGGTATSALVSDSDSNRVSDRSGSGGYLSQVVNRRETVEELYRILGQNSKLHRLLETYRHILLPDHPPSSASPAIVKSTSETGLFGGGIRTLRVSKDEMWRCVNCEQLNIPALLECRVCMRERSLL